MYKNIMNVLILSFSLSIINLTFAVDPSTCLVLGKSYTKTVTLRSGSKTKTVVAGMSAQGSPTNSAFDAGCMGRCGEGCGKDGGQGNYAQDCLAHDICTFYDKDFGGYFDRDCGDEFRRAIDDTVTVGQSPCWVSKEDFAKAIQ